MEGQTKKDAAFTATYGPMGSGKSVDLCAVCAGEGAFAGQPGGLEVAESVLGVPMAAIYPRFARIDCMEQVPEVIYAAAKMGAKHLGLDDASLLMKQTYKQAEARFATKGGFDFGMWRYLDSVLHNVAYASRWAGVNVVANFHVQEATTVQGNFVPKGPDLSWKPLSMRLSHYADLVQESYKEAGRARWDTAARCDERNQQVSQKNRLVPQPEEIPLNTLEMLRASGRPVSYPAPLAWMEEVVEAAFVAMGQASEQEVRAFYKAKLLEKGTDPRHIRWAMRDATHRHRIRRSINQSILADV